MERYIGSPPFQWQGEINQESEQLRGLVALFHPLMHWRDLLGGYQMTPVGNAAAKGVDAQIGRIYSLDGTDDCAYVALPETWKLQRFTVSAWLLLATAGGGTFFSLMPRGAVADGRGIFNVANTSGTIYSIGTGSGSFTNSNYNAAIAANTPVLITHIYDGANMMCYINGRQDSTKAATLTIQYADKAGAYGPNPASAYIGAYHNATNSSPATTADIVGDFNGQIGPVSLYNRALSAAEIWQLYDPQTRWGLYATPEYRRWFVPVVAGTIIPRVMHHLRQQGMS